MIKLKLNIKKEKIIVEIIKKYSVLGILSFIIALVCISTLSIVTIYDINVLAKYGVVDHNPFINALGIISIILNPIGTVTGIAAMFQKNTKKVFAIIGLILNGVLTVLSLFAMMGI